MKRLFSILCLSFLLVACSNEEAKNTSKDTSEESVQQEVEEKDYYTLKDDLPMIASILGEHEIVALGESVHGSLDLNKYKTDLIKELIDKHDFNKIYIESSKAETDYFNESNDENIIPEDILPIELLGTSFESLYKLKNVEIVGIDYGPYVTPTLTGNYVLDLITEDVSKMDQELASKLKSFEMNLMRWEINELDDEVTLDYKDEETTLEGFLSTKVDVPVFIDYKTGEFVPDSVTETYDHGAVKYKADMKKNQDGIIYIPKIEE